MTAPHVSIIIPAFNAEATIGATLASVLAQTFTGWEAIVVDDGSVDGTGEAVRAIARNEPRVRLLSTANMGVVAARNAGIEAAGGDLLLFLDADDWIDPDHLAKLTAARDRSGADVAYSGYVRVAANGSRLAAGYAPRLEQAPFEVLARHSAVAIHCVLLPRRLARAVGGFDPALRTCEDWDLWQRVARTGATFVGVPEPLAFYRMKAGSLSTDLVQMARDGAQVLAHGRSADARVPMPDPRFADGLPDPAGAGPAYFLLWCAAAAAAAGQPLPEVDTRGFAGMDLKLQVSALAELVEEALLVGAQAPATELGRAWTRAHAALYPLLRKVSEAIDPTGENGFGRWLAYRLELSVARHDTLETPLAMSRVHARRVDLADLQAIELSDETDLLHLRWMDGDQELMAVDLPVWGSVSARDLAEATVHALGAEQVIERGGYASRPAFKAQLIWQAVRNRRRSLSPSPDARLAAFLGLHGDRVKGRRSAERRATILRDAEDGASALPVAHAEQPKQRSAELGGHHADGAVWDRFFEQEDPWSYTSSYERRKYAQTLAILDGVPTGQVVELACAEGHFTTLLASLCGQLLATDISSKALERARARCAAQPGVAFRTLNVLADDLPEGPDLIVCSEVLYYMDDRATLKDVVAKLRDAVKPGGRIVTAHARCIVDDPGRTGFDWDVPFGAETIALAFAEAGGLQLERSFQAELYRIDLWRKTDGVLVPEIVAIAHDLPEPQVQRSLRWGGVSAREDELYRTVETRRVPVLMYHRVADDPNPELASYCTDPAAFEEQLRVLRRHGFYSITSAELDWYRARGEPLKGRPIILSFDDAYQDFLKVAWPILYRNNFRAEVLVPTGFVGETAAWDREFGTPAPLMHWEDMAGLKASGTAFGSHLETHRPADSLSSVELLREAARSRAILSRRLGGEVISIAAPFGNMDQRTVRIFHEAGYRVGYSTRWGIASIDGQSLDLPRIEMWRGMSTADLQQALGLS